MASATGYVTLSFLGVGSDVDADAAACADPLLGHQALFPLGFLVLSASAPGTSPPTPPALLCLAGSPRAIYVRSAGQQLCEYSTQRCAEQRNVRPPRRHDSVNESYVSPREVSCRKIGHCSFAAYHAARSFTLRPNSLRPDNRHKVRNTSPHRAMCES